MSNQHQKKISCIVCGKKVGLLEFHCKCSSNVYCLYHRYPESHGCNFNYKNDFEKKLEKENPVVLPPKVESI